MDESTVAQKADMRKHSLAVGRAAPDRQSVCHNQRVGGKGHQCAEGGLSGNPVRAERAERGRTLRVSAECAAAALVDSRTRRIVPGGECLCGEPPHLEQADHNFP